MHLCPPEQLRLNFGHVMLPLAGHIGGDRACLQCVLVTSNHLSVAQFVWGAKRGTRPETRMHEYHHRARACVCNDIHKVQKEFPMFTVV